MAAPSTMILLDPDLDPESSHGRRPVRGNPDFDPAPKATLGKRAGASAGAERLKTEPLKIYPIKTDSRKTAKDIKLPSARALGRFLASAQEAVRLKGQVTVLLTTDAAIRRLNKQFRGKNKATDVLSFPADGPVGGPRAERVAGDLAISVTTALGQAAEQGHSLAVEIKILILHGLLHLAGFDHEVDDGKMARRERKLRERLKLPSGLIERAGVGLDRPAGKTGLRQGLKPKLQLEGGSARLKSGPVTKPSKGRPKSSSIPEREPKTKASREISDGAKKRRQAGRV